MLVRCMTLRNSHVLRSVRAIEMSRGGLESSAIRPRRIFPKWRHSRKRPGRLGTRLIREYYNIKPTKAASISASNMISANDWSPKLTEIKKSVLRHYSFASSFFQHYQTCFGTCLAFWGSYWVLICTRWNLQLNCCNQSRETIKSFCLRLWRSVRLNHYLRAFSDSNVFVGF